MNPLCLLMLMQKRAFPVHTSYHVWLFLPHNSCCSLSWQEKTVGSLKIYPSKQDPHRLQGRSQIWELGRASSELWSSHQPRGDGTGFRLEDSPATNVWYLIPYRLVTHLVLRKTPEFHSCFDIEKPYLNWSIVTAVQHGRLLWTRAFRWRKC